MATLRKAGASKNAKARPAAAPAEAETERYAFTAEIPTAAHGALCRLQLQLLREPQKDGERLRLRAHLQTNFASALRPALRGEPATTPPEAKAPASSSRALAPARQAARAAGRGLQRVMNTPLMLRLTAPLLCSDLNTWVEIQTSTSPLEDGAHALVPHEEQLAALGIRPSKRKGPIVETWGGRTAKGYSQLAMLQLDKKDLPPQVAEAFGSQPFQLAMAVVNTSDRK